MVEEIKKVGGRFLMIINSIGLARVPVRPAAGASLAAQAAGR